MAAPIIRPAAALTACIDAMTPPRGAEEREAVAMAQAVLRSEPFPAASLETAACVWEAVLDMERIGDGVAGTPKAEARGAAIRASREAIGSSHLRLTALGWVEAIDVAWQAVDTVDGHAGSYGGSFDWEFVPDWIARNIDWSNPNAPAIRPMRAYTVPLTMLATVTVQARDVASAIAEARRAAEACGHTADFIRGWNDTQAAEGRDERLVDFTDPDVETIRRDEVEETELVPLNP